MLVLDIWHLFIYLSRYLDQKTEKGRFVCVFYTRLLPWDGSFYFKLENKRDILNTTLMTRITAHEQKLTNGGLNISITFNYLETMQMN